MTKVARAFCVLSVVGLVALSGCSQHSASSANVFTPEAEKASNAISGTQSAEWITTLASDEYEGRAPGTPGDEKSRKYIVGELQKLGYAPGAADGSWEQPVELVGITGHMPTQWVFQKGDSELDANELEDYVAASGVQAPS